MKKLITLFVALILGISASNAQHYRGFFEAHMSIPTLKMDGGRFSYDDVFGLALGGTTSHGVQLKNFFVGAGAGAIYLFSDYYNTLLPIFIDGRYDFFNIYRSNFFIDCKLGYLISANPSEASVCLREGDSLFEGDVKWNKLFFNPSVGIRIRCSNTFGVNFALGYMPLTMKFLDIYYNTGIDAEEFIGRKFTDHRLTLTIGIDF